jgi:ABC-type transporter Mla subunit MlaD
MATPQQRQDKIEEAKKLINELAGIKASTLSRTVDLSRDINFSEAVPFFEEMIGIIKQLSQRDISRLSFNQLNQIIAGCNQISKLIKNVNEFTLNQNTPADICKGIIDNVKNAYDGIMDPLTLPLAFTATQATDYAKIEREAKGYHATMKEEAENFNKLLDSYKNEAEKALHAVKEQAAEAGVATNAHIFLTDSTAHSRVAQKWLVGTVIISGLTLLVAIGFVIASFYYKPETTAVAIQYVVSKIILLSTLSFGIFWCARNYRSSKHNETLNKHRANALMTFRAFVEGSDDVSIKDAILLQAAQAAFSNRPTGYEGHEKEAQTINPVVEVLGKTLTKS